MYDDIEILFELEIDDVEYSMTSTFNEGLVNYISDST